MQNPLRKTYPQIPARLSRPRRNSARLSESRSFIRRYDPKNQRTAVIDANGNRMETVYDLAGRPVKVTNPLGKSVKTEYDKIGRPVKVVDPLSYETRFEYDPNGNLTKMTDANAVAGLQPKNTHNDINATIYKEYDELNRVKREVDALNGETSYTYDLLGNITSIKDAENHTTTFVYNDLGQLTEVRDPLVETPVDKITTFTYDEAGNVLTRTKRSGATAVYTYDKLNRMTNALYTSTAGSFTETTAYDIYGNIESVSNPNVTYVYEYDKNRPKKKTDNRVNKFIEYTYGNAGEVLTKTNYDGSETQYRYDSANRLVAERNANYLEVSYQYDAAGRLLNRILSNGAKTEYNWDDGNRLTSLVNKSGTGVIINSTTYARDRLGNITSQTEAGQSTPTTFEYDALYRLKSADYPDTANDQSYTYDKVGNRKTLINASGTLAYEYNSGNRLTEIRTGSLTGAILNSFVYDDDGNMTAKKDGSGTVLKSLTYDAKGRVTSVGSNNFAYDLYDYRIAKSKNQESKTYLLEGKHLEAIMNGNQWQAKYLRGAVIDEVVNGYQIDTNGTWTNYTFHHDVLQSVIGLTGHDGSILQSISYSPFGAKQLTAGAPNNRLNYTGREEDEESGLMYYRARYYDPIIGRFITEDPKGFGAGVNFYAYVDNNPINKNDPTGLLAPPWHFLTGFVGSLLAGNGIIDSTSYAYNQMAVDWRTETFNPNPAAQNFHGMRGYYSDTSSAQTANAGMTAIANNINSDLNSNLPRAGHNATDWATPAHRNNVFTGIRTDQGVGTFFSDVGSFITHSIGDWFPSPFTIADAISNNQTVIEAAQNGSSISLNTNGIVQQTVGATSDSVKSATGGLVIYPNNPNTNMMGSVYAKPH